MIGEIVRRLAQLPIVLLFTTIVIFSLLHLAPGDPVNLMVDVTATEEGIQALREKLGLDKPLHEQYLSWIWKLLHGDFGRSIHSKEPVLELFLDRFPISFTLATLAMAVAVLVAIPIGILTAYKHNTCLDYLSMFFALLGRSIPNFALGMILIIIFAVKLRLLPISGIGFYTLADNPWRAIAPWILPVACIATTQAALQARLMRSSMLEVIEQEYITAARAKGLRDLTILTKHALRNALIPSITSIMVSYSVTIGATIIIEKVFAIPGIATALIHAVHTRDMPVVQGFTLFTALFFIFTNLVADILYTVLDPRIRYG